VFLYVIAVRSEMENNHRNTFSEPNAEVLNKTSRHIHQRVFFKGFN